MKVAQFEEAKERKKKIKNPRKKHKRRKLRIK